LLNISNSSQEPVNIQIYDLKGQLLLSKKMIEDTEAIDIRNLNKGMYILKAVGTKITHVERLILQ
jgi:hypothetical protein